MTEYIRIYDDYLFHHGILGMKWGKRNGPPYPLTYKQHSIEEKRKNPKSRLDNYSNETKTDKTLSNLRTNSAKKHITSGASVVANYGSYNVKSNLNGGFSLFKNSSEKTTTPEKAKELLDFQNKNVDIVNKFTSIVYNRFLKTSHYKTVSQLPKIKNGTKAMDMSVINKDYGIFHPGTTQNCMMCTTAMVMRMKGYDVAADKTPIGFGSNLIKEWFPKATLKQPVCLSTSSFKDTIAKEGNGAYGNMFVTWKNLRGSHSVFWINENGTTRVLDSQANKEYTLEQLFKSAEVSLTQYARLDNCNPSDRVVGCLVSRENPQYSTDRLTNEASLQIRNDILELMKNQNK